MGQLMDGNGGRRGTGLFLHIPVPVKVPPPGHLSLILKFSFQTLTIWGGYLHLFRKN